MRLDNLNRRVQNSIQVQIAGGIVRIASLIFECNLIDQFIVCKQIAIAVKDLAAGRLQYLLFFNGEREIILITLSIENLQREKTLNNQEKKHQKDEDQDDHPASERICGSFSFFRLFQSVYLRNKTGWSSCLHNNSADTEKPQI